MYAQVEKQNENKSKTAASSSTQKKSSKQGFDFVDNRIDVAVQKTHQKSIENKSLSEFLSSTHSSKCGCGKCSGPLQMRESQIFQAASSVLQLGNPNREKFKHLRAKARRNAQNIVKPIFSAKQATATNGSDSETAFSGAGGAVPVPAGVVLPWAALPAAAINCAEAHIWMKIINKGKNPKNYILTTMDDRGKIVAPCANCSTWVYNEFKFVYK